MFTSYGTAAGLTRASFLQPDVETPVFVRFSTVLGSRGSADTVRDTRGREIDGACGQLAAVES